MSPLSQSDLQIQGNPYWKCQHFTKVEKCISKILAEYLVLSKTSTETSDPHQNVFEIGTEWKNQDGGISKLRYSPTPTATSKLLQQYRTSFSTTWMWPNGSTTTREGKYIKTDRRGKTSWLKPMCGLFNQEGYLGCRGLPGKKGVPAPHQIPSIGFQGWEGKSL